METKTIQATLLDRRSVRRYERISLTEQQIEFIHEAVRNTPTSYNGQQYSVIEIDDQDLKEQLYVLTSQKQIKTCARFYLFCADFNKITVAAKAKGSVMPGFTDTADGLIVGTIDAALAMMSALIAAESLGLGTCCIGYARTAAPEAISNLLGLPKRVYAVCGLSVGVPREQPDIKPKQPTDLIFHHNKYDSSHIQEHILNYDQTISEYNATRTGSKTTNDWVNHMLSYYKEAMGYKMLEFLRKQGFDLQR